MKNLQSIVSSSSPTPKKLVLDVGVRFIPTAFELVSEYLMKKVRNQELPSSAVVECDVYDHEPWNFQGSDIEYYFVRREKKYKKNEASSMPVRRVNPKNGTSRFGGFWKASTVDKKIYDKKGNVIARMKTLVFCLFANLKKRTTECEKTNWIMHEYSLVDTTSKVAFQTWVLCSIRNNVPNGVNQNIEPLQKSRNPQARARADQQRGQLVEPHQNVSNIAGAYQQHEQQFMQLHQNIDNGAGYMFEDLPAAATEEKSVVTVDPQQEQQMLSYYDYVFEDHQGISNIAGADQQNVQQFVQYHQNINNGADYVFEDLPAVVTEQESGPIDLQREQQMLRYYDNVFEDLPVAATQVEPMQVDRQQLHQIDDADYVIEDLRTTATEEEPVVPVAQQQVELCDQELTDLQTSPSALLRQSSFWKETRDLQRFYPLDDLDYSLLDKGWDEVQPLFL